VLSTRSKKKSDHMKPPANKLGTAVLPFRRIGKSGLFRFIGGEVPKGRPQAKLEGTLGGFWRSQPGRWGVVETAPCDSLRRIL
jgi:hypothetical protein